MKIMEWLYLSGNLRNDTIVIAINNTTMDQAAIISAEDLENDKELRGLLGTDMVRVKMGNIRLS